MIEIEKKFLPTKEQEKQLLAGARELGTKQVKDIYFDTEKYDLTLNDLWLRCRDGMYELKAPLASGSGSYGGTNRYHELTERADIAAALGLGTEAATSTDLLARALSKAAIQPFITCYTNRTSYEKEGFHIDVDKAKYDDTDFTYAVLEIELLVETEDQAAAADEKIMQIAQSLGLDIDQAILGKVAAYLKAEKPAHFQALLAADVLK